MAGISTGAPASPSLSPARAPRVTRTRRLHGSFAVGTTSASVHSTRRHDSAHGVTVTLGGAALQLIASMTPAQARTTARALIAAADAVESAQAAGGVR